MCRISQGVRWVVLHQIQVVLEYVLEGSGLAVVGTGLSAEGCRLGLEVAVGVGVEVPPVVLVGRVGCVISVGGTVSINRFLRSVLLKLSHQNSSIFVNIQTPPPQSAEEELVVGVQVEG